eukprot:11180131-Lingulodinium_polyedra.AAC.1
MPPTMVPAPALPRVDLAAATWLEALGRAPGMQGASPRAPRLAQGQSPDHPTTRLDPACPHRS